MSIRSYRRIYRRIQGLVRKNTPVAEGMCNLLDLCQEISPSPHWRKLYHLRFEDDLINLTIWLERLVTSEPPPKKVTGKISLVWVAYPPVGGRPYPPVGGRPHPQEGCVFILDHF